MNGIDGDHEIITLMLRKLNSPISCRLLPAVGQNVDLAAALKNSLTLYPMRRHFMLTEVLERGSGPRGTSP